MEQRGIFSLQETGLYTCHPMCVVDTRRTYWGLMSLMYTPLSTVPGCVQQTSTACSANDSKYGLQAGVFTHDLDKAWYAFEKLDVGGVVVGHVPSIRVDAQVSSQYLDPASNDNDASCL